MPMTTETVTALTENRCTKTTQATASGITDHAVEITLFFIFSPASLFISIAQNKYFFKSLFVLLSCYNKNGKRIGIEEKKGYSVR